VIKTTIALLLVCAALLSACVSHSRELIWAETTGKITNVTLLNDGTYAYTLVYNADRSTARNADGVLIKGPIPQHYFGQAKKPVDGQKIRMRYMIEEPVIFELLEYIRFVGKTD
jgi:hypothetical protein